MLMWQFYLRLHYCVNNWRRQSWFVSFSYDTSRSARYCYPQFSFFLCWIQDNFTRKLQGEKFLVNIHTKVLNPLCFLKTFWSQWGKWMKLDTIKVSRQRLGGKYNTNSKFSRRNYIELSPKNKRSFIFPWSFSFQETVHPICKISVKWLREENPADSFLYNKRLVTILTD